MTRLSLATLRSFAAASSVLLAGCDSAVAPFAESTANISVTTDSPVYHAGDRVTFSLRNDDSVTFGYGACSGILESFTEHAWALVRPSAGPCILLLNILDPGGTGTGTLRLDPALASGSYRVMVDFSGTGGRPGAIKRSNLFTIM